MGDFGPVFAVPWTSCSVANIFEGDAGIFGEEAFVLARVLPAPQAEQRVAPPEFSSVQNPQSHSGLSDFCGDEASVGTRSCFEPTDAT